MPTELSAYLLPSRASSRARKPEVSKSSPVTTENLLRHIAMDNETAVQHVMLLVNKTVLEAEGSMVYSGEHPEYGPIHIVVPLAGDGLVLLPFAVRSF